MQSGWYLKCWCSGVNVRIWSLWTLSVCVKHVATKGANVETKSVKCCCCAYSKRIPKLSILPAPNSCSYLWTSRPPPRHPSVVCVCVCACGGARGVFAEWLVCITQTTGETASSKAALTCRIMCCSRRSHKQIIGDSFTTKFATIQNVVLMLLWKKKSQFSLSNSLNATRAAGFLW